MSCIRSSALRTLAPGLVALGIYVAFVAARLALHCFDPSLFVMAGDVYSDPAQTPPALTVAHDAIGYDGQFYYRLALTPFTSTPREHGILLDAPAWRQQRILYPLAAWLLSLGDPTRALWSLIALNLLGLATIATLGARLAEGAGHSPWWGLVFAAYPGFVVTLSRDLTEIFAATFLLAGLLALRRERWGWAATALTLAVLSKETTLFFAAAVGAVDAWRRILRRPATPSENLTRCWVAPLLAFITIQLTLWPVWGALPFTAGHGDFAEAFTGFFQSLWSDASRHDAKALLWLCERLLIAVFCGAAAWRAFRGDATLRAHERVAFALYTLLAIALGTEMWQEDKAYLRALTEFYLLSALLLLDAPKRLRNALALGWSATWLITLALRLDWRHLALN